MNKWFFWVYLFIVRAPFVKPSCQSAWCCVGMWTRPPGKKIFNNLSTICTNLPGFSQASYLTIHSELFNFLGKKYATQAPGEMFWRKSNCFQDYVHTRCNVCPAKEELLLLYCREVVERWFGSGDRRFEVKKRFVAIIHVFINAASGQPCRRVNIEALMWKTL